MILKRIRLHNYCQHRDLDLAIEGTLIALTGPNGKGKSNLLGGIQFGLTGEHPGKNKDQLLSWGAAEGRVEIEFELEGVQATITRALHSTFSELQWGSESIRGTTQVNEALRVHLGMDKDLVKQAVFVRQAEIDSILFTTARERELAFQRLLGIGETSKIHKVLGDVISELALPVNYDEQIAQGKARHQELTARVTILGGQLAQIQTARNQAPQATDILAQLASIRASLQAAIRVTGAVTPLEEQDSRTNQAKGSMDAILPIELSLPETDRYIQDLQGRIYQAEQYQRAQQAWKKAGEAVLALGVSPYAPADLQTAKKQYDDATAEINRLAGRHKLHQDMLAGLRGAQGLQECPVCGSKVEDIQRLNDRLQGILQGLQETGTTLRSSQQVYQKVYADIDQATRTFQDQYTRLTAAYQQAESTLKGLVVSTEDPAALLPQIGELQERRRAYLANCTARQSLEATWKTHQGALERCRQECQAAITALQVLVPGIQPQDLPGLIQALQAQIPALEQQRDQLHGMDTEIARLQGMVGELHDAVLKLNQAVKQLEDKRAGQAGQQEALGVLGRVRDWFHFSNGPGTLSKAVLEALNQDVNNFLGQFTAPFVVEPSSETLGFRVIFTDGRETAPGGPPEASVLSGGERIQLAVAFRLSVYCMFAGKLGLLAMDEPTNFLDSANIGRFGEVLQKVKRIAAGMNLQLIVATHETSVLPFCDTSIDLTPK